MSWDMINGDANILPSGGNGNADEIRFESGKAVRVRLLGEPYSYLEHCIEVEKIENGQMKRDFRTVRCPKTTKNPNASCPLCDGQKVRRRVRHVCNVWDLDQNKVQKLNAGESVFKPIATALKLGADVMGANWGIMKTGTDRNDTEYTATNLGPSTVVIPDGIQMFNIEADYAPNTIDEMKATVESIGGDWNDLITPPQLVYPTLAEALAHVMPNGKHKGKTFQQMWDEDKSNRGMISFLATKSDRISEEKACAQVIMVRLGGANIEGVPTSDGQVSAQTVAQTQSIQQENKTTDSGAPTESAQQTTNESQDLIAQINKIFSTSEKFVKGGFNVIIETMKKYGNGKTNIVDFTVDELKALLEGCK